MTKTAPCGWFNYVFHVLMEVIKFNATHFHSTAKSARDYTLLGSNKGEHRG